MRIICYFFGHSFKHVHGSQEVSDCSTNYGATKISTWKGLTVKKYCQHCGYEHFDTFRIPGTEKAP